MDLDLIVDLDLSPMVLAAAQMSDPWRDLRHFDSLAVTQAYSELATGGAESPVEVGSWKLKGFKAGQSPSIETRLLPRQNLRPPYPHPWLPPAVVEE